VVGQNAVADFDPDKLRGLRHDAGLTQEQLERRANLPARTVVQYENGWRAPYPKRLKELADALGATPDDMIAATAQTLAHLRARTGLTQKDAATRAGLVRTTYSAIERGEIATLDEDTATRIAQALGITVQQVRTTHAQAIADRLATRPI
jgi:transcriptional regulator with XRE-family HTH domain